MNAVRIGRRQFLAGGLALATSGAIASCATSRGFLASNGLHAGIQLYMLGEAPAKDLDGTLARVADIGYREIELPGLLGHTPAELRAAADRAGLAITAIHLQARPLVPGSDPTLEDGPARIGEILGTLGANDAIVPIVPLPDGFRLAAAESFGTAVSRAVAHAGPGLWARTAALLNEHAAALRQQGVRLGYHNHNLEFAPVNATTGWDVLVAETDPALVSFEVDIGWVAAAGLDPVRFVERHAGRLRWMHLKDIRRSNRPNFAMEMDPTEVGSGSINWARLLPAARAAGVRHFYVEQEPPFAIDRFEAAARSFAFLAKA